MDTSTSSRNVTFIRDLPLEIKQKLAGLFDKDHTWERMVPEVCEKNNQISIDDLKNEEFPGRTLLNFMVGNNVKVTDVYEPARELELSEVVNCIKDFVMLDSRHQVDKIYNIKYIFELPEDVRRNLCCILNANDEWKYLHARFYDAEKNSMIRYDMDQIQEVCGSSPSSELLKLLGDRNFTVDLLYLALASLDYRRAQALLEIYVSDDMKNSSTLLSAQHDAIIEINEIHNLGNLETSPDTLPLMPNIPDISSCSTRLDSVRDSFQEENGSVEPAYFPRGESVVLYRQLTEATNDWSTGNSLDSTRKVNFYRGLLNGKEVAIKKLGLQENQALEEIRKLRSASNKCENILEMLMFIEGNDNPCLVYPLMRNGSLYDHINIMSSKEDQAPSCLTQETQTSIAYGIVKALSYLHSVFDSAVVVKSSDILLGESMTPLIADVCLPCKVHEEPSKDLSLYMPQTDRSSIGQNHDRFCLGTIVLELAVVQTADKLTPHPLTWFNKNNQFLKNKLTSKKLALMKVCYVDSDITIDQIRDCWSYICD